MFRKSSKSGKRTGRKNSMSLQDMQKLSPEQSLQKLESDVTAVIANIDGQNSFFCTDEPFIT